MRTHQAIIFAAALATVSCAGSPTAPTVPRPAVHAVGQLAFDTCINSSCDGVRFSVTNEGPGCADPTTLRGNVMLRENDTIVKTGDWELTLSEKVAGVFRPGQTRQAVGSFGTLTNVTNHVYTFQASVTSERAISCQ
jgi:hypothetical protein